MKQFKHLCMLLAATLLSISAWGTDYVLYTESTITAGNYVLVGQSTTSPKPYYAMNNTCTSNQYLGITSVTPTDDVISSPSTNLVWAIAASTNGFYIKNGDNYLDDNATSSKNYVKLNTSSSETCEWLFVYDGTKKLWSITNYGTSTTKKTLSFNISSTRVACYASAQTGVTQFLLYKESTGSPETTVLLAPKRRVT